MKYYYIKNLFWKIELRFNFIITGFHGLGCFFIVSFWVAFCDWFFPGVYL